MAWCIFVYLKAICYQVQADAFTNEFICSQIEAQKMENILVDLGKLKGLLKFVFVVEVQNC